MNEQIKYIIKYPFDTGKCYPDSHSSKTISSVFSRDYEADTSKCILHAYMHVFYQMCVTHQEMVNVHTLHIFVPIS